MDFLGQVCCCCYHDEDELEKNSLNTGDTFQYFNKLQKWRQSEAANLWNEPADSAHVERGDDHELHKLLEKRSKMRRGSEALLQRSPNKWSKVGSYKEQVLWSDRRLLQPVEEKKKLISTKMSGLNNSVGYRRLSFDIIAHRQIRRKVKDRWKHVLEVLGFKAEADGLLTVTSCTSYESLHNPQEARRLHTILAEQTSIFGHHHGGPPERYLFVLDRLILLDVGDDFLSAAQHFYPVEEEEDNMSSSDGGPSTPGPILVQLNNETQKEAEVEQGEELNEDYAYFGETKLEN